MIDKFGWMKLLIQANLPDKAKLVGVALWNYTNEEGKNAYPGTLRLAEDLGVSEKTVTRALTVLRAEGWIVKSSKRPRDHADTYQLAFLPDQRNQRTQLCPLIGEANETDRRTNRRPMTDKALSTTDGHSPVPPTDHLTNHLPTDQEKVRGRSVDLGKKVVAESKDEIAASNKKTKTVSTTLPAYFSVTREMRDWAGKETPSVDVDGETNKFREYHQAKGTLNVDWTAAWRYWMRNAKPAKAAAGGQPWF